MLASAVAFSMFCRPIGTYSFTCAFLTEDRDEGNFAEPCGRGERRHRRERRLPLFSAFFRPYGVAEKSPKTGSDRACPHGVQFYDVVIDGVRHERAAWSYEEPLPRCSRSHTASGFGTTSRSADGNYSSCAHCFDGRATPLSGSCFDELCFFPVQNATEASLLQGANIDAPCLGLLPRRRRRYRSAGRERVAAQEDSRSRDKHAKEMRRSAQTPMPFRLSTPPSLSSARASFGLMRSIRISRSSLFSDAYR